MIRDRRQKLRQRHGAGDEHRFREWLHHVSGAEMQGLVPNALDHSDDVAVPAVMAPLADRYVFEVVRIDSSPHGCDGCQGRSKIDPFAPVEN